MNFTDKRSLILSLIEKIMYSQELLIYTITTDATKLQQFVSEKYWIVMSSNGLVINDKETRYLAENDVKTIVSMGGPAIIKDSLRVNFAYKIFNN